jgi:hypothetical protein
MIWLGIDVGYHNMALVQFDTNDRTVIDVRKIDISQYTHNTVCKENCTLQHTNHVSDMIIHMIQEHGDIFDTSEHVFIERQPPTGMTAIESLFFYIFRNKCTIVSPNSMHKYFGMTGCTYEERKARTVEIATKYLKDNENFLKLFRKHDVADALCLLLYQYTKIPKPKKEQAPRLDFEKYRLNYNK